jgi:hypothetical protein
LCTVTLGSAARAAEPANRLTPNTSEIARTVTNPDPFRPVLLD